MKATLAARGVVEAGLVHGLQEVALGVALADQLVQAGLLELLARKVQRQHVLDAEVAVDVREEGVVVVLLQLQDLELADDQVVAVDGDLARLAVEEAWLAHLAGRCPARQWTSASPCPSRKTRT